MILGQASPGVTRRVYADVMRKVTAAQVVKATELLTQHRRPDIEDPPSQPARQGFSHDPHRS
jgi:hypothetical protein